VLVSEPARDNNVSRTSAPIHAPAMLTLAAPLAKTWRGYEPEPYAADIVFSSVTISGDVGLLPVKSPLLDPSGSGLCRQQKESRYGLEPRRRKLEAVQG